MIGVEGFPGEERGERRCQLPLQPVVAEAGAVVGVLAAEAVTCSALVRVARRRAWQVPPQQLRQRQQLGRRQVLEGLALG